MIYKWIIKLSANDTNYAISIGIDSSNKEWYYTDFGVKNINPQYCYCSTGMAYNWKDRYIGKRYGYRFYDTNYKIKMILNTQNTTLQYYVDDKDQGIAFDNILFKQLSSPYYFAIFMQTKNKTILKIKLIDFQQISIGTDE